MIIEGERRIDTHAFLGKSKNIFGILKPTDPYFNRSEHTSTQFLVVPFEASANRSILRQVARDPKFLGMYLMFNPNEELPFWTQNDGVDKIADLMRRPHVVGLKSLPSLFRTRMDDPRYLPYYEVAQRYGMPVLLHAAASGQDFNSAEMTKKVLDLFPDLIIILAHFGGGNPRFMEAAVRLAEECDRLKLNTTTMHLIGQNRRTDNITLKRQIVIAEDIDSMRRDALDIFVGFSRTRPRQILFGSDLGYNPPEDYSCWPIDQVEPEVARMIFVENPRKLFGNNIKRVEQHS